MHVHQTSKDALSETNTLNMIFSMFQALILVDLMCLFSACLMCRIYTVDVGVFYVQILVCVMSSCWFVLCIVLETHR